jgi:hypothetical protein
MTQGPLALVRRMAARVQTQPEAGDHADEAATGPMAVGGTAN